MLPLINHGTNRQYIPHNKSFVLTLKKQPEYNAEKIEIQTHLSLCIFVFHLSMSDLFL